MHIVFCLSMTFLHHVVDMLPTYCWQALMLNFLKKDACVVDTKLFLPLSHVSEAVVVTIWEWLLDTHTKNIFKNTFKQRNGAMNFFVSFSYFFLVFNIIVVVANLKNHLHPPPTAHQNHHWGQTPFHQQFLCPHHSHPQHQWPPHH